MAGGDSVRVIFAGSDTEFVVPRSNIPKSGRLAEVLTTLAEAPQVKLPQNEDRDALLFAMLYVSDPERFVLPGKATGLRDRVASALTDWGVVGPEEIGHLELRPYVGVTITGEDEDEGDEREEGEEEGDEGEEEDIVGTVCHNMRIYLSDGDEPGYEPVARLLLRLGELDATKSGPASQSLTHERHVRECLGKLYYLAATHPTFVESAKEESCLGRRTHMTKHYRLWAGTC